MAPARDRLPAVQVQDVHKTFRIPHYRMETLKERVTHPFARIDHTLLHALREISFDVAEGEFMGIVGRNGSGKTTLLKLLASIYRADQGEIWLTGTLAPFIELGVGFNPNLTARGNVLLNGVMMGLTPREARRRFDEVIEFAELEGFVDLPLKNYSTGMATRLAFSVMVQSEAEIMLVDEVLAVGDASFAQRCLDTFERQRQQGRTVLFVTHDMESLRSVCDRAILIENGVIDTQGDPEEVARRYFQINFEGPPRSGRASADGDGAESAARITDVWLENAHGERTQAFEHGSPIQMVAAIEATGEVEQPEFGFEICATDGVRVFAAPKQDLGDANGKLAPGDRLLARATVANPLSPGSYVINCGLSRSGRAFDIVDSRRPAAQFVVWGKAQFGYVQLDWQFEVERDSIAGAVEPERR